MIKWLKSVLELVKDVKSFLYVRKEQKEVYGTIVADLENINNLSIKLNEQIKMFSKKWNLFAETDKLLVSYKKYISETQELYKSTRKEIINNLLAERNRGFIIGEEESSIKINRQLPDSIPKSVIQESKKENELDMFVKSLRPRYPLLCKILDMCNMEYDKLGEILYIYSPKDDSTLNMLKRYKKVIEDACIIQFGNGSIVEILYSLYPKEEK